MTEPVADSEAEQPRELADPSESIAPEVLSAARFESDPSCIADVIGNDVRDGAATVPAVRQAASALEEHQFVDVSDGDRIDLTDRGMAVAFVRGSPTYTLTLYCHVQHRDPVPIRVADEWVQSAIGEFAANLAGIGNRSVLGDYNPLGEYVGDGRVPDIRPTKQGRHLATAMRTAWRELVGEDRAWALAKEVVGRDG